MNYYKMGVQQFGMQPNQNINTNTNTNTNKYLPSHLNIFYSLGAGALKNKIEYKKNKSIKFSIN